MDIENDTDGDAKVRVSGGQNLLELHLKPGEIWKEKDFRPAATLPPFPWTIQFFAPVTQSKVQSRTAAARLTLAKNGGNKFTVKKK